MHSDMLRSGLANHKEVHQVRRLPVAVLACQRATIGQITQVGALSVRRFGNFQGLFGCIGATAALFQNAQQNCEAWFIVCFPLQALHEIFATHAVHCSSTLQGKTLGKWPKCSRKLITEPNWIFSNALTNGRLTPFNWMVFLQCTLRHSRTNSHFVGDRCAHICKATPFDWPFQPPGSALLLSWSQQELWLLHRLKRLFPSGKTCEPIRCNNTKSMQSKTDWPLASRKTRFGGAIFCQAGGKKLSFVPTQAQAIYIYIIGWTELC